MRMHLIWKEAWSVGVKVLDDDHKKLLDLSRSFLTAHSKKIRDIRAPDLLDELVEYTKYHFSREEKMMHAAGFPGLAAHRDAHNDIIVRLKEMKRVYRKKGGLDEEMDAFLMAWLRDHILQEDKKYAGAL